MAIATILLDQLDVMVRRGFEVRVDAQGRQAVDREGALEYVAEIVVPGHIASAFATDNDRPATIRLRAVGWNPGFAAGTVLRLSGQVTATVWYVARNRGSQAKSNLTITAERIEQAPAGTVPMVRGGLPAVFPADVPATFLGQTEDGRADLMFAAAGPYTVNGMAEIRVASIVPDDLIGQEVVPVGLRAFFTIPDPQDTSARSRSELVLSAAALEPVVRTNGRSRKADPVPAPAGDAPAEG